jgi:DNA end-binding protein Ku
MAARSAWKGFLRFSLVSIPVKAYTATSSGSEIRLNQIHRDCNRRIKYQKVCPIHGELAADQIVSGYEFAKDQFVVIDPEEISKLRPEGDKSVTIDAFVPPETADPTYFSGKTYFLVPDGGVGFKPYALLLQGMKDLDRCAVAQFVLHGRTQLGLVRPVDKLLALSVLSYDQQVVKARTFEAEVPPQTLETAEAELAKTLIKALTPKKFDLTKYKDDYSDRMTQLIEAKIRGQEIVAPPAVEHEHVINLMDALKKSLKRAQGKAADRELPAANPRMAKSKPPAVAKKKKKSS